MREKITKKLLELGIKPSVKGFYFLIDAIDMYVEEPGIKMGVCL